MRPIDQLVEDTGSGAVAAFTTARLPAGQKPEERPKRRLRDSLLGEVDKRYASGYKPSR